MPKKAEPERPFWGWCECECPSCEMGAHHFCPDTVLCRMPKTFQKDEMRRKKAKRDIKPKR